MKKIVMLVGLLIAVTTASAQFYYKGGKNVDMIHPQLRLPETRNEIILPQVDGYTIYKADLHTHTVFSDGHCNARYRAAEAWRDGLDVMAVTEHIEYRPNEKLFLEYMKATRAEVPEGQHTLTDLNMPVKEAQKWAKNYGLTIIPGVEITRNPIEIGHYNALFTTDNNIIYDKDPLQAMRNARAQGALVMHNHPGWRRTSLEMPEVEKQAYEADLIDGVESMNGAEFYPKAITRAVEKKIFVAACTDIHASSASDYHERGDFHRNMTFILAKDKSLESLKEALQAGRTIAYSFGTLAGEEELMKKFFLASVTITPVSATLATLTNHTSVAFYIVGSTGQMVKLSPFSSIQWKHSKKTKRLQLELSNIWVQGEKNLTVSVKVK